MLRSQHAAVAWLALHVQCINAAMLDSRSWHAMRQAMPCELLCKVPGVAFLQG
jgi:hypothetical protein